MTLSTRTVEVVEELPAGTQKIGSIALSQSTTDNQIQISQTSDENKIQISDAAGENNVVVTGTVAVSNLTGSSSNEENVETAAICAKGDGPAQLAVTAFFADGLTSVKLDEMTVKARVGMTVEIYKDDGSTQTLIDTLFISGDGGEACETYSDVAKNKILTTAGGDDRFYASFVNNDKTKDAFGYALFKFTIVA